MHNQIRQLGAAVIAAFALPAFATVPCDLSHTCAFSRTDSTKPQQVLLQQAASIEYAAIMGTDRAMRRGTLARSESKTFSGVGTITCIVDGVSRASTAFLVGRFDLAVTVAHTFRLDDGRWALPQDCTYVSSSPGGGVSEQIAVAAFSTQWQAQPESAGQPAADVAVVRLSAPVRAAQRTLPFAKFAHSRAPVVIVGFRSDLSADVIKRKALGTVFRRPGKGCVAFAHNADSRRISAGAPVIDVRDGVVIGIHTRLRDCSGYSGNAMIVMTPWLEQTLRSQIAVPPAPPPVSQSAQSPQGTR